MSKDVQLKSMYPRCIYNFRTSYLKLAPSPLIALRSGYNCRQSNLSEDVENVVSDQNLPGEAVQIIF